MRLAALLSFIIYSMSLGLFVDLFVSDGLLIENYEKEGILQEPFSHLIQFAL